MQHVVELAQGEYWQDLRPFREQILSSLEWFWRTFAPLIDEAVG